MILKIISYLFFLCVGLASCQPIFTNEDQSNATKVLAVPTLTVPAGQMGEDVPYDEENIAWIQGMMAGNPNGISVGLWPAYKNRYVDRDTTFFMVHQDSFIAQAVVGNWSPELRDVAVVCLLDYIQIGCAPQLAKEHIVSVPGQGFAFVPVELTDIKPGLHDFNILAVRDPYLDGRNAVGDNIRFFTLASTSPSNILVDGLLAPPDIERVKPRVAGQVEGAGIVTLTYGGKLTDEFGNIPIWVEAEGQGGEMLTFDLNFLADIHDEDGDTIAVMAFLNYEQIPLIYEGHEYLPLFVERQAGMWQRATVHIQLPDTPGTYELVVMGRTDAFSTMEDGQAERDLIGTEESNRIKIIVNP
ncbi:MAG TPA: hypothetical protein PLD25_28835 [Chloroflexota bacterium]|nr:hypothetical protein [Chloroflexota bacterium]HUM69237.1 hypothetical protein [Chloroflexota bacterium]